MAAINNTADVSVTSSAPSVSLTASYNALPAVAAANGQAQQVCPHWNGWSYAAAMGL
jgi:hypothetical protein